MYGIKSECEVHPDVQRSWTIFWSCGSVARNGQISKLSSWFYTGKEQLQKWSRRGIFDIVNNLFLKGTTMKYLIVPRKGAFKCDVFAVGLGYWRWYRSHKTFVKIYIYIWNVKKGWLTQTSQMTGRIRLRITSLYKANHTRKMKTV